MTKASQELLAEIHGLIAEDMRNRLVSGTCEAKDWAVIVKFLKDNDVTALLEADTEGAFNDLVNEAKKRIQAATASFQ
jgi:hypothetical protein